MKVLLIAGHGAGDSGAVGKHNGVTYQEATLARNVVAALRPKLEKYMTVSVYPTERCAYDDYRAGTLKSRASFGSCDYVLEVHFNAYKAAAADGKTKGVEAYMTTSESGITVEEAICKNIAALGFTNRGVKRKNWSVIATAKSQGVSSCLLEVCFIDDPDDMAIYNAKFDAVVDAIARGIVEGFNAGSYSAENQTKEAAWKETSNGKWYEHADGSYTTNGWELIDGIWYWFDEKGYMATEKFIQGKDGAWYYVGEDGKMITNAQVEHNGKLYTFDGAGVCTVSVLDVALFSDVPEGAWYSEAVAYCVENGLLQGIGDGKFDPEGTATRAQLATAMMRLHKALK